MQLRYRTLNAAPEIVAALQNGSGMVTCDGREHTVEVVAVEQRYITLRIGKRTCRLAYAVSRGHVFIAVGGASVEFVPSGEDSGVAAVAAGVFAPELTAPMPGKILQVMAVPGDEVAAGEVVVLMEAMKMETALRVPADCCVVDVRTAPGETVSPGQVLVVLRVP